MSKIKGRGNKETELVLVDLFRKNRIKGWRRHHRLLGKPDFVFKKEKVVVFVDGCFWHCCPKHSNMPVNNREFWHKKLTGNRVRDKAITKALAADGWIVLRIWEHDLNRKRWNKVLRRISRALSVQASRAPNTVPNENKTIKRTVARLLA